MTHVNNKNMKVLMGDYDRKEYIHPQHKKDFKMLLIIWAIAIIGSISIFILCVKFILWLVSKNIID